MLKDALAEVADDGRQARPASNGPDSCDPACSYPAVCASSCDSCAAGGLPPATGSSAADNTVLAGRVWGVLRCLAAYRLEPMIFTYTLGGTLVYATAQNLMLERVCSVNLGYNQSVCDNITELSVQENRVQTLANKYLLYQNLVQSGPGIVFALLLGPWSDTYGRRPLLLLALMGTFLSVAVYMIIIAYDNVPAQYLILAAVPVAFSGGSACFMLAAFSYVSDVSGLRDRTTRISLLEVCFFAPLALGFLGAGYALRRYGYMMLYLISLSLVGLSFLYGLFCVPESLPCGRERPSLCSVMHKVSPARVWHTVSRRRTGCNRSIMLLGVLGFIVQQMSFSGESVVTLQFVMKVYHWSYSEYTNYICFTLVGCLIFNIVILPVLSLGLRVRDSVIGLWGIISRVAGLVLRYFAHTSTLFYMATLAGLPGVMISITLRSLLSKCVSRQELGVVFSVLAAAESICTLAASSVFLLLYNALLLSDPAAIYLATAALASPVIGVFFVCLVRESRGEICYGEHVEDAAEDVDDDLQDAVDTPDTSIFQPTPT